jgi:magnesium transporter
MMDLNEAADAAADRKPWKKLGQLIHEGQVPRLEAFLDALPPWEQARAVSRLSVSDRTKLMKLLPAQRASDLMEVVTMTQGVDLIAALEPDQAAAIVDGMRSDHQAALVRKLAPDRAEAILEQMVPDQADEARKLASYPANTAGGIMVTEYLAFPRTLNTKEVVSALRAYARQYQDFQVGYAYVTDNKGRLIGVLRLRDLLFAAENVTLNDVMIGHPIHLRVDSTMDQIQQTFEQHKFLGLPVVDEQGRLVGVVTRDGMEEASNRQANSTLLLVSGIIGGEEYRSMPLRTRAGRRLGWLTLNIFLNLMAASVVAAYEQTLQAAVVLAVFMPIISDMCGCSGNQAVAVSMRELTLGLVRPSELLRVIFKEAAIGIINGITLGCLLALIAYVWKGNGYLGLVVGIALGVNTLVSVVVGGALPLIGKAIRLDPALLAPPVLTTITDMTGFFLVLSIASRHIEKLAPAAAAVAP